MKVADKTAAKPAPKKAAAKAAAKAPAQARGRGRPAKYDPKMVPIIARFCEKAAATDVEVADLLGVDVRTVYRWKAEYPEFCQALKLNKAPADDRVEVSLYKSANGYEVDETDIRVIKGKIVKTTIRKHYPPHPTSMIFWLKNRKPADWRQQPDPMDPNDEPPPPVSVTVQVVDGRKPGSGDAKP